MQPTKKYKPLRDDKNQNFQMVHRIIIEVDFDIPSFNTQITHKGADLKLLVHTLCFKR